MSVKTWIEFLEFLSIIVYRTVAYLKTYQLFEHNYILTKLLYISMFCQREGSYGCGKYDFFVIEIVFDRNSRCSPIQWAYLLVVTTYCL